MNSSLLAGNGSVVVGVRHSRRNMLLWAMAAALVVAIVMLVAQSASPASAQISIGSIVCPILRSIAAIFSGFLGSGFFNTLLAAFGC